MPADLPQVPPVMSLEGRAVLIADIACRMHPSPAAARKAVEAEALAHLRVVHAQAAAREAVD